MAKEFLITEEGLVKLKDQLAELKEQRKEVIERLKTAKEFGDLSENAEFDAAKNEQTIVETKIGELTDRIKHAKIVSGKDAEKVGLGSKIVVESDLGKEEYELVSPMEAKPLQGKISLESPFGKAFMNAKVGDKVHVNTPDGIVNYKILKIS